MTEKEWLKCRDPIRIIKLVRETVDERKIRLFFCACIRQMWPILTPQSRLALETIGQFADGVISVEQFAAAHQVARDAYREAARARQASGYQITELPSHAACAVYIASNRRSTDEQGIAAVLACCSLAARYKDSRIGGWRRQRAYAVDMLSHIIGNPFRPYAAPPSWPAAVVALAEALYQGEPCQEPLHDALLEAGHPELAEHFRAKEHPKGCWVLDLILGKR